MNPNQSLPSQTSPNAGMNTMAGVPNGPTGAEVESGNPAFREDSFRGDDPAAQTPQIVEVFAPRYGMSGTKDFAGFLVGEEYNAPLIGRSGLMVYDRMRKGDSQVQWSLQAIKLPIRSGRFRIEPASDDPKDIEISDFVDWNLFERLPWHSSLREMLTFLEFGFFLGEKAYQPEDYTPKDITVKPDMDDPDSDSETITPKAGTKIVLTALESRKQTTVYRWQQGDGSPGVQQITSKGTFNIPMNRLFLVTREREGNNYAGVSILRSSYRNWYMKDVFYKISGVAAERQGVGVVMIKYLDGRPSKETRAAAIEAAQALRANPTGYLEIPDHVEMEFMELHTDGNYKTGPDIEHHNRQIMVNVGAGFMEMGATRSSGSTGGSKSASSDQSEVYEKVLDAVAAEIEEAIDNQIIKELVNLNYTGITRYPKLVHDKIGEADMAMYADGLSKLLNSDAVTPDPDMEEAIRDRMDLPPMPEAIRKNWATRIRAQASTVPENQPGNPINDLDPDEEDPNAPTPPTQQKLVRQAEKFYGNLERQIDGLKASRT